MLCATDAHVQGKKVSLQLSERERIQLCTEATSTKSAPIYRPHILNLVSSAAHVSPFSPPHTSHAVPLFL